MPMILQVCCALAAWGQRHAHLPCLLSSVSAIVSCGIPPGNCLDWKTKSEAQGPHQCLLSPTQRGLCSRAQRYEGHTVDPGQYLPPALPPSPLPAAPTAPRRETASPGPTAGPVGAPSQLRNLHPQVLPQPHRGRAPGPLLPALRSQKRLPLQSPDERLRSSERTETCSRSHQTSG